MSMRLRRGSAPTTQGTGEIFGPTNGSQSVRDNAGPRPITVPPGAIPFTSASDLSNKLSINPVGSTFVAANGISPWNVTVNTAARKPKIYIPNNFIMSGGSSNNTGLILDQDSELHGGIWTNFGSVDGIVPMFTIGGSGTKLIQDATFHTNFDIGVIISGNNTTLDHCLLHTNGRYGINAHQAAGGSGAVYPQTIHGVQVTNCEWYNNNTRNLNKSGNAGGTKFLHCYATYAAFNWAHDNNGSGLWFDYNPGPHLVEENVFENNDRWGMFYEVGTGDAVNGFTASAIIRHNYLTNNATDTVADQDWFNMVELLASCSDGQMFGGPGYEIHNNLIDTTRMALGFIDHNQPHPFDVKNFWAHDNDVWLRTTTNRRVGGKLEPPDTATPFSVAANNRFTSNHYHVQNTGIGYWYWNGAAQTWAQWQALGKDQTGSLEQI